MTFASRRFSGNGAKMKKRKSRARTMSQPESEGNLVYSYAHSERTEFKLQLLQGCEEVEVLLIRPRDSCLHVLTDGLEWLEESDHGNVFGFDLEWKPDYGRSKSKSPIALLQLSTKNKSLLVHAPQGWDERVRQCMVEWLSKPAYLKVGIGMSQDRLKLQETLGYEMPHVAQVSGAELGSTWIDLSAHHVFLEKRYSASMGFDGLFGLFDESEEPSRRLVKEAKSSSQKRRSTMSKWDAIDLNSTQVSYAVFDAWGAREIFLAMSQACADLNICDCSVCQFFSGYDCSLRGIKKTFHCSRCRFITFTQTDLDSHLSRRCAVAPKAVPIEVPLCHTCYKCFGSAADLEWHQREAKHGKYRLECEQCGEVFKTNKSKTKTAQKKAHACQSLGCSRGSSMVGVGFADTCDDRTAQACAECSKMFNSALGLQLHALWHAAQKLPPDLLEFTNKNLDLCTSLDTCCGVESRLSARM